MADTVLFAGVTRALVATLIEDIRTREKVMPVPGPVVSEQLLAVARGGAGQTARLLERITPQLDAAGDTGEVYAGVERLRRTGTGAQRQRHLWKKYGPTRGFIGALAAETVPARI